MMIMAILAVASASSTASAQRVRAPEDLKKVICTREIEIGSLIARRRCRTLEQILAEREQAISDATRLSDNGTINPHGQ